jgi:TonB family protein
MMLAKHLVAWPVILALTAAIFLSGCAGCGHGPAQMPLTASKDPTSIAVSTLIHNQFYYPVDACRANQEGDVHVMLIVRRSGEIESVRVYKSSGHPLLDQEALRVFEALRIRGEHLPWPADLAEDKQKCGLVVPVVFRLTN